MSHRSRPSRPVGDAIRRADVIPLAAAALMSLMVVISVASARIRQPGGPTGSVPPAPPGPQLEPWLEATAYLLVMLTAATGTYRFARRDVGWWLLTTSLVLRAAAYVVTGTAVSGGHRLDYPSVADALWVLSSLLLISALLSLCIGGERRRRALRLLDVLAAACVVGGVVEALADRRLSGGDVAGRPVSAPFDAVYLLLDVATLLAVLLVIVTGRRRAHTASPLLLVGVGLFALSDRGIGVAFQLDAYRPGGLLASATLVASAIMAIAVLGARRGRARRAPHRAARPAEASPTPAASTDPGVPQVVPLVVLAVSLLALVVAASLLASSFALALFAAAAGVSTGRGLLGYVWMQRSALNDVRAANLQMHRYQALIEASTDLIALTDAAGQVLYLNPAGRRMLRSTDVTNGLHLPGAGVTLPRIGEDTLRPLDGSPPVPVAVSTFEVRDDEGDLPYAVGTIQRDISARLGIEAELRRLAMERAALLTRLVEAQEEERHRVAGAVHDEPLQTLAAVNFRLDLLRRRVTDQKDDRTPTAAATVDELQDLVSETMDQLRDLLFDLEPPGCGSLRDSLERAAGFVFAGTSTQWRIEGGLDLPLPKAETAIAYRIGKEALFNARKHAEAEHVVIRLSRSATEMSVVIDDDGRGITSRPGSRPGHRGLSDMQDRARVIGGQLDVTPGTGGGTQVRLIVPTLRAPDAGPAARSQLDS